MSKNTTTAGKTAKTRTQTASKTPRQIPGETIEQLRAARIERWRKIAAELIEAITDDDRAVLEAAAGVAGLAVVDFIIEQTKAAHGLIPARDNLSATFNRKMDDDADNLLTPRSLAKRDREVVDGEIFAFTHIWARDLTTAQKTALVRRFYIDGDTSLSAAEGRAIRAALDMRDDDGHTKESSDDATTASEKGSAGATPTASETDATESPAKHPANAPLIAKRGKGKFTSRRKEKRKERKEKSKARKRKFIETFKNDFLTRLEKKKRDRALTKELGF